MNFRVANDNYLLKNYRYIEKVFHFLIRNRSYLYLICFIIALYFLFFGNQKTQKLESTLDLAGENQTELQKVLDHYSQNPADSLKLEAAKFLIENMRWHSSRRVEPPDSLWTLFLYEDSLLMNKLRFPGNPNFNEQYLSYKWGPRNDLLRSVIKKTAIGPRPIPDLQQLSAGFLINNIDMAFKVKQHSWCKDLSFEEFCEYVLPYRFNNEPVYMKRETIYNHFHNFCYADSFKQDPVRVISWLNGYLKNFWWNWEDEPYNPDLGFYNIFYNNFPFSVCTQQLALEGAILRSAGMPLTEIFTPYMREANKGHSWCALIQKDEKTELFNAVYNAPRHPELTHTPFAATKLYKRTFSVQPESPIFLKSENELLPGGSYALPVIKDVTADFVPVQDVELKLTTSPGKNNLCWFSIFTRGGWSPIGWGEVSKNRGKVTFKNIPVGLTGLACFFDGRNMIPCSRLVTINENGLEDIEPDGEETDLLITRKFPSKVRLQRIRRNILGTKVQGANLSDFSDSVTLYTINDTLQPCFQDFEFNNNHSYRYYRLYAPTYHLQVAEVEFLTGKELPGTVQASPLPVYSKDNPEHRIYYKFTGREVGDEPDSTAFDGNLLTYSSQKWTGLKLGVPQVVNRIRVAPRNALNGIVRGNNYQLFYWDNGWQPAGTVKSQHNFVEFRNVPANTLYWLRNLDHGVEEQPFFYENGKQVFSNPPIQ